MKIPPSPLYQRGARGDFHASLWQQAIGVRFMINRSSIIVPEGLPFIMIAGILTLLSFILHFLVAAIFLFAVMFFVAWFFRNPERKTPQENTYAIAPADGKVIKIEEVSITEPVRGDFKRISIFMSVFNVHVNRIPYSGIIKMIRYKKGNFFAANLDKASPLNEQNAVLIETDQGKQIMAVQIAGLIARRIVCWVSEGARVEKGQRFGLIRFGSRVDVYLPLEAKVLVKIGDKVCAGETSIGDIS
jgi:phosphatidylserine decarboxylase